MSDSVVKMIVQIAVIAFVLVVAAYLLMTGQELPSFLVTIIQTIIATYFVVKAESNLYKEPPK